MESQLIPSRSAGGRGRLAFLLFTLLLISAPAALAQSAAPAASNDRDLERGVHEWEFWIGGGGDPIGTPKVTLGNSILTVGARYGWVLTKPHGPGFIRGRFEYAVDAIPIFYAYQPAGKAYGIGFTPWIMKWNLVTRRRISPYIEVGGGTLVTTKQVPLGASTFNFTPTGALGVNILRGKYHWSIDFRYFHVSDAQLTSFNPGTDTFGVRLAFGMYSHKETPGEN
jgi:hypothetical protein